MTPTEFAKDYSVMLNALFQASMAQLSSRLIEDLDERLYRRLDGDIAYYVVMSCLQDAS